jgi:tetratricopeptide (TPR) repeat protein
MTDSDSGPDVLGQVTDELLERYRRGERPALTDYVGRYPALAAEIRALFSVLVLMEDVRPGPPPAAEGPAQARAGAGQIQHLGEYRLVREIGRGGMGVVYEAEQESLGRRVALKVLAPEALRDPRYLQRFQREARAAARLHHTHIVPVFGVGEDQGTHYYVMQYIEGRPLGEVLAELRRLRADASPGSGPAPDSAAGEVGAGAGRSPSAAPGPPSSVEVARSLWEGRSRAAPPQDPAAAIDPDVITRRENGATPPAPQAPGSSAADAGAGSTSRPLSDPHRPYAQSVAHIGAQVAEALEYAAQQGVLHRDIKPSNLLLDVWGNVWLTDFGLAKASGTPDLTRTGDLLGTLRYMAPERFQGRADVRSDVYALGLTLYEALALRPAFDEAGQMQLMQQITTAEPLRLDRLTPPLPRDLVTVVHKAMAKAPGDRYQTAGALAEDLHRFLEDRPIAARRLGVLEQAWRWGRRNPALAGLLAALLALALLASGGGVWLVQQRAERQTEAARQAQELRQEVGTALAQAVRLRHGFHFGQGRELLEQARQRLAPAEPDDLRRQVDQALADLDLAERLDGARLRAASIGEQGKFDFAGAERRYAAAFAAAGLSRAGDDSAALAARVNASAVRAELVGALDDWASICRDPARRAWLLTVVREADPDPARDRLRQPELWRDDAALTRVAREVRAPELSPQLATALGRALHESGRDAAQLLSAAQARFPNDFWLNFDLGGTLYNAKRWNEALGYYRAALALRPEAVAVHNSLGNTLNAKGQLDEAIAHYQDALRLDPEYALAHYNLGNALKAKGQLDEAIAHYQEALRLDPELAYAHNNLGLALYARGQLDQAIAHYQDALRLDPGLALAHNNLGWVLKAKGQLDEAIAHYQEALRLDPEYALAHNNLGNALKAKGQLDEAIAHYQDALRLGPTLALAHYNLGVALTAKGQLDEAIAHYQDALWLDPKYAMAHNNLGNALYDKGQPDEAITHYQDALRLDPKFAYAHIGLGRALSAKGQLDDAIAHYQDALRLDPKLVLAHNNLGVALSAKGQLDEAIAHYQDALRLDPKFTLVHNNLSEALLQSSRFQEARAVTRQWLDLLPADDPQRASAFQRLQDCERRPALEAKLPLLLEGKAQPVDAAEQRELAALCQNYKRLYATAARFYAGAFAARPKLADDLQTQDRYNAACAAALAAAGQGADAAKLGDAERARLRRQALEWLTADLVAWEKRVKDNPQERARVQQTLRHWQADSDLVGIRDTEALAQLPPAEREACRKVWADVDALLRRAHQK